jgi:hypothetical protein
VTILGAEGEQLALIDFTTHMGKGDPAKNTGFYRDLRYWNPLTQQLQVIKLGNFMQDPTRFGIRYLARPQDLTNPVGWFVYDPDLRDKFPLVTPAVPTVSIEGRCRRARSPVVPAR